MTAAKISAHKVVHSDHSVIHPPNTLKEKALSRTKISPQEQAEHVARADRALESLTGNFTEWMHSETMRLNDCLVEFENGPRDVEAAHGFFMVAHDFRGQAKQFGYPIAAQIAQGLCDVLQSRLGVELPVLILRRYVEAITAIVRSDVRDEANETAVALARSLAEVVSDYRARLDQEAAANS